MALPLNAAILQRLFFLLLVHAIGGSSLHAQLKGSKGIKEQRAWDGKQLLGLSLFDRQGNTILSMSNGLMGPVAMVYCAYWDSTGRDTLSIMVHSNVGCFVSRNKVQGDHVFSYEHRKPVDEDEFPRGEDARRLLAAVRSRGDIESLAEVVATMHGELSLSSIKRVDTLGRDLEWASLSDNGDTSTVTRTIYSTSGEQLYFHYDGKGFGEWEYHATLDSLGRRTHWTRIELREGRRDTSDVTVFLYDKNGRMAGKQEFRKGRLTYTEEYVYGSFESLVEKRSVNTNDPKRLWITRYARNRSGKVQKEIRYEVLEGKKRKDHEHRYTYAYW